MKAALTELLTSKPFRKRLAKFIVHPVTILAIATVVAVWLTGILAAASWAADTPAPSNQDHREPVRVVHPSYTTLQYGPPVTPTQPAAVGLSESPLTESDPLLEAMQEELERTRELLRMPKQPSPYFVSFWVQEVAETVVAVRNGALLYVRHADPPQRKAAAQIRVGSYEFDNSQLSPEDQYHSGSVGDLLSTDAWWISRVPVQDNQTAIRATLWRVADSAYKRALADYHKRGALQALTEENVTLPDFSREEPVRYLGPAVGGSVDYDAWQARLEKITHGLMTQPEFQDATATLEVTRIVNYYVNSEGTHIRQPGIMHRVYLRAETQAPDGIPLKSFYEAYARDPADLPDEVALQTEAHNMARELIELRAAPKFSPYSGPAILDGDVAGVFFHEALGHRLEGQRQRRPGEGQTFKEKVGEQILPTFLTVIDDPTLKSYDGQSLAGFYRFDSEGVPAQRVVLVRNGVLTNFLMSRTPVQGFLSSNGHGRAEEPNPIKQPVGRMANLLIQTTRPHPWKKLKRLLLKEARRQGRPYGLIIRGARSGETYTGANEEDFQVWKNRPRFVYRVDVKTGQEQLVRGVELVGTPLNSLEHVIAAGDRMVVFNAECSAESGTIPAATISPALLTTQVELQRIGDRPHSRPILPSPFQ